MKLLQFALRSSQGGSVFNVAYLKDGLIEKAFNESDKEVGDGQAQSVALEQVAEFINDQISSHDRVITITVEIMDESDLSKKENAK